MTGHLNQILSHSHIHQIRINGTRLIFSMNQAPRKAPIIIYLHGGPGDACIPLTMRYNAELEKDFRLINVDQRGSGLSYHPFAMDEVVTISSMVEDVHQFVLAVLEAFQQDSLILIGHSWGSVLGLEMVRRYPSLISNYIGLGQVVTMQRALTLRQSLSRRTLPRWGQEVVDGEGSLADLVMLVRELMDRGSLRTAFGIIGRAMAYIRCPYYSCHALINQLKGVKQSRSRLNKELEQVDFSGVVSFGTPVTFVGGKYDRHIPASLVERYAATILTEHHFIWFGHSGHCPQWDEPSHFAALVRELCLPKEAGQHNSDRKGSHLDINR